MAPPTQKLPSKLEGAHDVKVEVVERAFDQPSIVLEDLHLSEVEKSVWIELILLKLKTEN